MLIGLKRIIGVGLLLAAGIALSGCNTMKIEDFAGKQPVLKPETYFLGETRGSGMFHDRFGNLRRQFVVDMVGEMDGDVLVLTEDFVYDDGEKEQRVWHLKPLGGGLYEGVAGDVVGKATGQAVGNAFQWSYRLDLKVGEGRWRVAFDDWMFLQPGGVILNRATMTRWGIEIGTLTVSFHKKGASSALLGTQPQAVAQAAE
jgi:hypothetical protein